MSAANGGGNVEGGGPPKVTRVEDLAADAAKMQEAAELGEKMKRQEAAERSEAQKVTKDVETSDPAVLDTASPAATLGKVIDTGEPFSEPQGPLHNIPNTTVPRPQETVRDTTTGGFSPTEFAPAETDVNATKTPDVTERATSTPAPDQSTENNGALLPPAATAPEQTPTPEQAADAKRNNAAKELLINDPNAVAYLEKLGISDPKSLDVAKQIEILQNTTSRTPQQEALLKRLQETQGLVLRQEAQETLDELGKRNPPVDKNAKEYQDAKKQFEAHELDAERRYIREAIRQDNGLRSMLEKAGYDLEDFDIQQAIQREGDSKLGARLKEVSGQGQTAVLEDGVDYDTTPEERSDRMKKIAKAGTNDRSRLRRTLDKISDGIAQFSGAEIRDAFNQAKGWKKVMKYNQKLLKDSSLDPDKRDQYKQNLKNAKELRNKALWEGVSKRGAKILFFLFLIISASLVVGPAILPAKLMEWGGKGAGGH